MSANAQKNSYYRPEIDGLRAVAILSVLFFHAEFSMFPGGYIGVDVFFVLSGFLITSILLREFRKGTFSFFSFWERRIRRILPALFAVLVAVGLFGFFILLFPADVTTLGRTIVFQSIFLSNMFFMTRDGYFSPDAENSPLLHTWTLAVEEQFYIFFPFILFILMRFWEKTHTQILGLLFLVSLFISIYLIDINPGGAFSFLKPLWGHATFQTIGFYSLPSRAWELFAGAILASTAWSIKEKKVAEAVSWLGLSAILYTVFFYDALTPFPGIAAMLPVFGTVAVIAANTHTKTRSGEILSKPALVWVGLISYSLYLWHWPIFVYAKALLGSLSAPQYVALILLSIFLSWVSFRFIETPFREKKYLPTRKHAYVGAFVAITLTLFGGTYLSGYSPEARIPKHAQVYLDSKNDTPLHFKECVQDKRVSDYEKEGPCLLGVEKEDTEPSFVLWGDSHAGAMMGAVDAIAKEKGVKGALFAYRACPPVLGVEKVHINEEGCKEVNEHARKYIEEHDITEVILIARWNFYLTDERGFLKGNAPFEVSEEGSKEALKSGLSQMLEETFPDKEIIILGQPPENTGFDLREYFYDSLRVGGAISLPTIPRQQYMEHSSSALEIFSEIQEKENLHFVDPLTTFCTEEECFFEEGGVLLYRDNNHVNTKGATMLKEVLGEVFPKDL